MKKLSSFLLCATFAVCPAFAAKPTPTPTPLQPVNLGSAATFAVLAGSEVTNTGNTVITGDLGLYPAAGTFITGFTGENAASNCCGVVNGTIDDTGSGEPGTETTAATHAQASLTIAINDAAGRTGPCPCTAVGPRTSFADLTGATLHPGLFKSATTLKLTGTVTLDGAGVYIFQIGSGLTVNTGAKVILTGGATAANVFWQVGTLASLGTDVTFEGNILAGTAVTFGTRTSLVGRALAKTAVTLQDNAVTLPK